jgi:methylenetetrahydrofolate dehydrogenase (NADP+) / methenyltetrahydrofolate cyclohydrolase
MKIDGKQISQEILDNLIVRVGRLKKRNIFPKLAIIIVGNDPSSIAYINQKKIKAELIGAKTTITHFSLDVTTSEIIKAIQEFNNDEQIHGIVVQQPLPKHVDSKKIINSVDIKKDIDGFTSNSHFQVPISMAVLKILEIIYMHDQNIKTRFIEWLKNKKIAVIGKGETGGKPIIQMFEKMKIFFSLIDSKTKNPESIIKNVDVIITAVGKKNIIKPQIIKKNVALIGIGISKGESAKFMGDYDQNEVKNIASFYTPTPGGIGPINVSMLLKNLISSAENLNK